MYVQEVKIKDKRKYLLVDSEGNPVTPVVKYLKYLDHTGKSYNTLKTYCYGLKHYFTFLEETEKDYKQITLQGLWRLGSMCKKSVNATIKMVILTQIL